MDLLRTCLTAARPSSLLVDVGANEGGYTSLMRQAHPTAEIHAFEPIPALYEGLSHRFAADPFTHVYPYAVSNVEGLDEGYAVHEAWTLDKPERARRGRNALSIERDGPGTFDVYFTTLDRHLHRLDRAATPVDVLKVDTDGYEYRVLQGAEETLLGHRPLIWLEVGYCVADLGDDIAAFLHYLYVRLDYRLVRQEGVLWTTGDAALAAYPYTTTMDVLAVPTEKVDDLERASGAVWMRR